MISHERHDVFSPKDFLPSSEEKQRLDEAISSQQIGLLLRCAFEAAGLVPEDIGRKFETPPGFIKEIFKGTDELPSRELVMKLVNYCVDVLYAGGAGRRIKQQRARGRNAAVAG